MNQCKIRKKEPMGKMTQKDLHVLNGFFIKGLPHVFGATSRRGVIRVEVYVEVYFEVSLKFTLKFTLRFKPQR
jgi:hypothetical protein